jgi:hypothetical protein
MLYLRAMVDAAKSKLPPNAPADEPQGSLGAVLIGGAILAIAALLIFWPDSDAATKTGAGGKDGAGGQQASNVAGGDPMGAARGIQPRAIDPAEARTTPQVTPGLLAPTDGLAMMPQRKPEPTSFPTAAAEIAHFEKKLVEARENLVARTTFLERMNRQKEQAPISEMDRINQRAKVVQENYDKAVTRVEQLELKVAELKRKQAGGG